MPSHKRLDNNLILKGQPELLLKIYKQLKLPIFNILPKWEPLVI